MDITIHAWKGALRHHIRCIPTYRMRGPFPLSLRGQLENDTQPLKHAYSFSQLPH